jgi:glycosyltransferase involved in cell wall biosynthesis
MKSNSQPFVSIVTPVYNAEKYLNECIESVLNQTYQNWEYVIVNNCSTDNSKEIAIKYSKKDKRIRVHDNKKFLKLMQNWNYSMHQISPKSKYCKVVHADDWLFPECIEKMVEVAEKNTSVGIVSAYRLDETRINLDGLPYPSTIVSGRLICRLSLLENIYVFGSPTSTLIRSSNIRARDKFYEEHSIHADEEVCYEILKKADLGFVHKVLTYTRRHNESVTSLIKIYNTHKIRMLIVLKKYGSFFLNKEEYNQRLKRLINNHHKYLGHSIFELKNKDFFNYHINELHKLGIKLNYFKLMVAVIKELLNPLDTFKIVIKNIKKKALNS